MHQTQHAALKGALPILAVIIGGKFGVIVRFDPEAQTASTDGKIITMPPLPVADVKAEAYAIGYIGHEAGHVAHTNFDVLKRCKDDFEAHMLNVIEDPRIDTRTLEDFPGYHYRMTQWHHHALEDGYVGVHPESIAKSFCTYVNTKLYMELAKQQILAETVDSTREMLLLFNEKMILELDSLLDTKLNSTEEVYLLTLEIKELLEREAPELIEEIGELKKKEETSGDSRAESIRNIPNNDPVYGAEWCTNFVSNPDFLPGPSALQAASQMEATLARKLQAKKKRRLGSSRAGRALSSRHLHRAVTGDSRIYRGTQDRDTTDVAIEILEDRSISMRDRMKLANEASFSACLGLESISGIKIAATAFPGPNNTIISLKRFDDETNINRFGVNPNGTTPLANALIGIAPEILARKESRKMIFVVTDGEPDNPEQAKQIMKTLSGAGIEFYGIGIGNMYDESLFLKSRVIHDINQLTPQLFDLLSETLT